MQSVSIFFRIFLSFLSLKDKLLVCQAKDLFSPREVHHNKLAFTTGAGNSVVGWIGQIRVPLVILGNNYLLRRFPVLPALPARWLWAHSEGKRNCWTVPPSDRPSHDNATNQINNFSWAKQVEKNTLSWLFLWVDGVEPFHPWNRHARPWINETLIKFSRDDLCFDMIHKMYSVLPEQAIVPKIAHELCSFLEARIPSDLNAQHDDHR